MNYELLFGDTYVPSEKLIIIGWSFKIHEWLGLEFFDFDNAGCGKRINLKSEDFFSDIFKYKLNDYDINLTTGKFINHASFHEENEQFIEEYVRRIFEPAEPNYSRFSEEELIDETSEQLDLLVEFELNRRSITHSSKVQDRIYKISIQNINYRIFNEKYRLLEMNQMLDLVPLVRKENFKNCMIGKINSIYSEDYIAAGSFNKKMNNLQKQ